MNIEINLFPGGKTKALTMSYDDGVIQDRRLVEIFDSYGIKGTFNLNSTLIKMQQVWSYKGHDIHKIQLKEIKELYKNQEVAVHSCTHPRLEILPKEMIRNEIYEDKRNLEDIVGYPIRGMAYPFGTYNKTVKDILESSGIEYSRTVKNHDEFILPDNYLEWNPTCHHNNPRLMEMAKNFLEANQDGDYCLFYVWGHSYEFDIDNNWYLIEDFCKYISNKLDVWYATNVEIIDYLEAVKQLKFSVSSSSVYNPTSALLWIKVNGEVLVIKPGETRRLG